MTIVECSFLDMLILCLVVIAYWWPEFSGQAMVLYVLCLVFNDEGIVLMSYFGGCIKVVLTWMQL